MSINTAIYHEQSSLTRMPYRLMLFLCRNFVVLYSIRLQIYILFVRYASLVIGLFLGFLFGAQKCPKYAITLADFNLPDSWLYGPSFFTKELSLEILVNALAFMAVLVLGNGYLE